MEGKSGYFIVSVGKNDGETSIEGVERTVGKGWFAFDKCHSIEAGDWLCFYAAGVGVVAKACAIEKPYENPDFRGLKDPNRWCWFCRLSEMELFTDSPIVIDSSMRSGLDAFEGKNPDDNWGWFVQTALSISPHDFQLLTSRSE